MTANTPQSRKAKGRKFQQQIRDLIRDTHQLQEDDVRSTSMGAGGEDIPLSPAARTVFPYSVECKCVEKLNIRAAYEQASENSGEYEPVLFFKSNRKPALVVLDAEYFVRLTKQISNCERFMRGEEL